MFVHFAHKEDWDNASEAGKYESPDYAENGFMACWMPEQATEAANEHYSGQDDLVLLWIAPMKVSAPILYKRPPGQEVGDLFPFVNGPLNLDAVVRADELEAWEPGGFVLPKAPPV